MASYRHDIILRDMPAGIDSSVHMQQEDNYNVKSVLSFYTYWEITVLHLLENNTVQIISSSFMKWLKLHRIYCVTCAVAGRTYILEDTFLLDMTQLCLWLYLQLHKLHVFFCLFFTQICVLASWNYPFVPNRRLYCLGSPLWWYYVEAWMILVMLSQ